jgi:transposase
MVSAVDRGMPRRCEDSIDYLGIDEKSSQKGHRCVTVLTDIGHCRVLDLVKERKLAAAKNLMKTLSPKQRQSVKAVAMAMWPALYECSASMRPASCHRA